MSEPALQIKKMSRATYTAKAGAYETNTIYFVIETDNSVSLYFKDQEIPNGTFATAIALTNEALARANADSALGGRATTLEGKVSGLETYRDDVAPTLFVSLSRLIAGLALDQNISSTSLTAALNEATTELKGLMSSTDKQRLNQLYALLASDDADALTNTIQEILNIFENYSEGLDIVANFATKVDKTLTINGHPLNTNVTITKSDVGLGNVDNTSDANKPVSTAQQTALDAKAGKFYATNLVTNGNFANGTTGWTVAGTVTIVDGTAVFDLASGANIYQAPTITSTHKYYLCFYAKNTDSGGLSWLLRNDSTAISNTFTPTLTTTSAFYSSILISTSSGNRVWAIRSTTTGTVSIDNVLLIDLTALYGAGSEPTQVEMDKYLAQKFTNSYFDGTVEYATLSDITGNKASVIKATNIVTNGNFTSTTGWTTIGGAFAWSVASNEAVITNLSASASTYKLYQTVGGRGISVNDKVYMLAYMLSSSASIGISYNGLPATVVYHSGSGTYERLATIGTCVSSTADDFRFCHTTLTGDITATPVKIKWAIAINLTKTFGAGKEPTVAQMNAYLAYYPNSWFNGTIPFITLQMLLDIKANKISEDWITPTLLNSWTTTSAYYTRYKKDGTGVVWFEVNVTGGASGTTSFQFVSGYRPTQTLWVIGSIAGAFGTANIDVGGNFQITTTGASCRFVGSFRAD